ncbi:MAG: periplasmic heavy metal sensor [Pseudomonadota bacterium]
MKRYCMPTVLVLSLLLNVGVLSAVGFQVFKNGKVPAVLAQETGSVELEEYLQLNAAQLPRWREQEQSFMEELDEAWVWIHHHRTNMIHEIFSEAPQMDIVERERQAIAELQEEQQHKVIQQLLKEREMLDQNQRARLVRLLLDSTGSMEEISTQLHQH